MPGDIFSHLQDIIFNFKRCSHFRIITSQHHFVNFFSVRNNNMTQKVKGKMAESSDERSRGREPLGGSKRLKVKSGKVCRGEGKREAKKLSRETKDESRELAGGGKKCESERGELESEWRIVGVEVGRDLFPEVPHSVDPLKMSILRPEQCLMAQRRCVDDAVRQGKGKSSRLQGQGGI